MWQTDWGHTSAMVVLRLFRAFIPLAMLWVRDLIIDMADRIIVLQTRQLHWMIPLQVIRPA
jgi:hypothetical protein